MGREKTAFKGEHEIYVGTVNAGRQLGSTWLADMRNALPEDDWHRVRELAENPKEKLVKGGQLTGPAKTRGYTDQQLTMAKAVSAVNLKVGHELHRRGLIDEVIVGHFPRETARVDQTLFEVLDAAEYEKFADRIAKKASDPKQSRKFQNQYQRVVPFWGDLLDLERRGVVKIKEKDPTALLARWLEHSVEAVAMHNLKQRVKLATRETGDNVYPIVAIDDGRVPARVLANNYAKFVGDATKGIRRWAKFLQPEGVKAAPDAIYVHNADASAIRNLLAIPRETLTPSSETSKKIWEGLLAINGVIKRAKLSFSAFHHVALSESAIADMGFEFLRHPIDTVKIGVSDIREGTDAMRFAVQHGLQLGAIKDFHVGVLQRAVETFDRMHNNEMLKIGEKFHGPEYRAVRAVGKAVGTWDRGLWDFYHNGLKMAAFQSLYSKELARQGGKNSDTIARAIAQHVNNAFGGQVWENMVINRNMQDVMRLLLLAPDWTLSNIKSAGGWMYPWLQKGAAAAQGKVLLPDQLLRSEVTGRYSRRYVFNAILAYGGAMNLANYAFNGHFMWDNPKGHRWALQLPWDDNEGRAQYLPVAKQFREIFEFLGQAHEVGLKKKEDYMLDFWLKKRSPVMDILLTQGTGRDFFGRKMYAADADDLEELGTRLGHLVEGVVPLNFLGFFDEVVKGDWRGAIPSIAGLRLQTGAASPSKSFSSFRRAWGE
jgi:hypothetical protein